MKRQQLRTMYHNRTAALARRLEMATALHDTCRVSFIQTIQTNQTHRKASPGVYRGFLATSSTNREA